MAARVAASSLVDRELDTMGVIEQVMDDRAALSCTTITFSSVRCLSSDIAPAVARTSVTGSRHTGTRHGSAVVALNQEGGDYDGGGTALRDHAPVVLRRGECLVFVGSRCMAPRLSATHCTYSWAS